MIKMTFLQKYFVLFCISLFASNTFGQNYFLSFKAAGISNKIDSIQVTNITLHTTKVILGDEILNLRDTTVHITKQIPADKEMPAIASGSAVKEFNYRNGDLICLTGFSGINKTVVITMPQNDTIISFRFDKCVDIDGNSYAVMQIGKQLWMVENLQTTRYRNGDTIPNATNKSLWNTSVTGAYRNYFDMEKYVDHFGRLYNWYAVNDRRGLAPEGWRIPDVDDWNKMENTLMPGDKNTTGSRLKEMALTPAGYCNPKSGFGYIGKEGYWWLSFDDDKQKAWYTYLLYNQSSVSLSSCDKNHGFSVRCVKDLP